MLRYWQNANPRTEPPGYILRNRGLAPDFRIAPTDTTPVRYAVFIRTPDRDKILTSHMRTLLEARTYVLQWYQDHHIWAYSHRSSTRKVEFFPEQLPTDGPYHNHFPRTQYETR